MLLAASEGRHWRYEVHEHADGYLVHMRDLDSGELDDEFATIFRTLPVAFAYAEMSAAYDRYAASETELPEEDEDDIALDLELSERSFTDLSARLDDTGLNDTALQAWERRSAASAPRRVLH